MILLVDTREQLPFAFDKYQVDTNKATLPAGDYSLPGFEDRVAVERKSLNDLVGCLTGANRERFERELQRLKYYDLAAVVCEGSWQDLSAGRYRSEMKPQAVLQSILAFMVRYRVNFIMAGSREAAEYLTHGLLEKYFRQLEQGYRRAVKSDPLPSQSPQDAISRGKRPNTHGTSLN